VFERIDPRSPTPLYAQIASRIRIAVSSGDLLPAALLPSVRELALQLRINPATVAQAYRELERDGFVEIRRGSGTFVRELAPGRRARERAQQARALIHKLVNDARRLGVTPRELRDAIDAELGVEAT